MPTHLTIDYIAAWATFGTALGTIGLACATFVMAQKTQALAKSGQETADAAKSTAAAAERELELVRAQADAARRQTEAAEAALQASIKPLLVGVPLDYRPAAARDSRSMSRSASTDFSVRSGVGDQRTGSLSVPVRNVGAGVARGLSAVVTVARRDAIGEPVARGYAPSLIVAGEIDRVTFEDTPGPASVAAVTPLVRLLQSDDDLVVEVAYSDVAGRQEAATSLYLTTVGETHLVTSVEPGHERRLTTD